MIYATALPIEKYDVEVDGNRYGMYSNYGHLPALLALIAIGTPMMYDWEEGVPMMKRRVELTNVQVFLETLKCEVGGKTIKELLETLDPLGFYAAIENESLAHLPIVKEVLGGTDGLFKLVVGARAAGWALNYRGKLSTTGKVTKVSFGGKVQSIEVSPALKAMHIALKKEHTID